jgi:hypothetical protein
VDRAPYFNIAFVLLALAGIVLSSKTENKNKADHHVGGTVITS